MTDTERLNASINKLNREQFDDILDFLSGFAGLTDLGDDELKDELWRHYEKEIDNDGDGDIDGESYD